MLVLGVIAESFLLGLLRFEQLRQKGVFSYWGW